MYQLAVEDFINNLKFEDTIAITSYGWDLPDPLKPSNQPYYKLDDHGEYKGFVIKGQQIKRIPYRSLVPVDLDNVIVAGRSISCERDVLGPIRVMAPCMAMGQAAGTAGRHLS